MTSQRVERTWIRTGGYGRFRGEWVKDVFERRTSTRSEAFFFFSYSLTLPNVYCFVPNSYGEDLAQEINCGNFCKEGPALFDDLNRVFSHDVTAATLVSQNNKTAAMLVFQTNPVGAELFSYANAFFCSNKFA